MLPATFLAGMTLPLFTFVMLKSGSGEKAIGRVYAANTFGAIVGVVFATTGGALGAALFAQGAQVEPPTPSTVPPSRPS